jgi:hypothetical protein
MAMRLPLKTELEIRADSGGVCQYWSEPQKIPEFIFFIKLNSVRVKFPVGRPAKQSGALKVDCTDDICRTEDLEAIGGGS